MRKELLYSDPFLKGLVNTDPTVYRFFICSFFDIYFKVEVTNNILSYFKFFVIGSFFINILLEDFTEKSLNKSLEEVKISLKDLEDEVETHKYFTKLDKDRSLKMILFLKMILKIN
jgi:hypothetical protein